MESPQSFRSLATITAVQSMCRFNLLTRLLERSICMHRFFPVSTITSQNRSRITLLPSENQSGRKKTCRPLPATASSITCTESSKGKRRGASPAPSPSAKSLTCYLIRRWCNCMCAISGKKHKARFMSRASTIVERKCNASHKHNDLQERL